MQVLLMPDCSALQLKMQKCMWLSWNGNERMTASALRVA